MQTTLRWSAALLMALTLAGGCASSEGPQRLNIPSDPDRASDGSDLDQDSIPNAADRCPEEPEDLDGYQDEDGCPEYDNDLDGILDVDDPCLNTPEDPDGFEDDDGCPEEAPYGCSHQGAFWPNGSRVPVDACNTCRCEDGRLTSCTLLACDIQILEVIYFKRHQTAVPLPSQAILNEIARALEVYPKLLLVVQGHASKDERRPHATARRRAEAVRDYLVKQGIVAERLSVEEFGATRPIYPKPDHNRRVDFKVIDP